MSNSFRRAAQQRVADILLDTPEGRANKLKELSMTRPKHRSSTALGHAKRVQAIKHKKLLQSEMLPDFKEKP